MPSQLDTADGFAKTLAEVDLLLTESDNAGPGTVDPNERRVSVMNKAALLLLMGKFEAFMETTVDDFVGALNSLKVKGRHIPERILLEHSVRAIQEVGTKLNGGDLAYVRAVFSDLAKSWGDQEPCVELKISAKFSYGKHGAKEVERLYSRIGFGDLFARVSVDDPGEVYDGAAPKTVDVPGLVNSLTNIRNNILHQDATPQLTSSGLRKQSDILRSFATKLVGELQNTVNDVEHASNAEGAPPEGGPQDA